MALSKISLGKCPIALENMWVIFKHLLILILNIILQWWENRLWLLSISLDRDIFAPCLMFLDMSHCLLVYVYGNLNGICILLLCENCINLNYAELVHSAFQVYCILPLFSLSILLIFESLILKLQLKILIYPLKKQL